MPTQRTDKHNTVCRRKCKFAQEKRSLRKEKIESLIRDLKASRSKVVMESAIVSAEESGCVGGRLIGKNCYSSRLVKTAVSSRVDQRDVYLIVFIYRCCPRLIR